MDGDAEGVETLLGDQKALRDVEGVPCGPASLPPRSQGSLRGCFLEPVLQMLECLECILFPDHFLVSKERTVKL